jgi:microcystin-dependent protein
MAWLDYSVVEEMSSNELARLCWIRASSIILLLSCLSLASERWQWRNDGAVLTDAEWDDVSAWFGWANYDLMEGSMIGAVLPFVVAALPDGVLLCDGSTYDKDDYPNLWAVMPAGMKTSDEFTVPDLRDKFIRGGGVSDVGNTGGEDSHTLTTNEIPSHNHGLYATGDLDVESIGIPQPNAMQLSPVVTLYTASTGGGASHENRPAFYTLVYGVVAW